MDYFDQKRNVEQLSVDEIKKELESFRTASDYSINKARALFSKAQSLAWTQNKTEATKQLDITQGKQLDILLKNLKKPRIREQAFQDFIRNFSQDLKHFDFE